MQQFIDGPNGRIFDITRRNHAHVCRQRAALNALAQSGDHDLVELHKVFLQRNRPFNFFAGLKRYGDRFSTKPDKLCGYIVRACWYSTQSESAFHVCSITDLQVGNNYVYTRQRLSIFGNHLTTDCGLLGVDVSSADDHE